MHVTPCATFHMPFGPMGNSLSGSLTRMMPRATEHSRVLDFSAAQRKLLPGWISMTWNVVPSTTGTARPWAR